ncbi:MAG: antibiotic biosynthesis monooxygenase [Kofleriaceae bacterium]
MQKFAIVAHLEAKPRKEKELHDLLVGARPLAVAENFTRTWYAWQTGPRSFGIFDTFDDEGGRKAHLEGQIAKALMGKADELLASPPDLRMADLLAVK